MGRKNTGTTNRGRGRPPTGTVAFLHGKFTRTDGSRTP
jgi:hypothetical protein